MPVATASQLTPSRTRLRTFWRIPLAVSIMLLMVVSGVSGALPGAFESVGGSNPSHGFSLPAGPHLQVSGGHPVIETPKQLQQDPYQTSPGTALNQSPNTTILGQTSASQSIQFTIGFSLNNVSELTQ
ncbi:MAG: hypothetical protein L3K03_05680, partial [Thermoplasmata archaeon]|nr:hypothetical protein [Thermoplasmata archaeon]